MGLSKFRCFVFFPALVNGVKLIDFTSTSGTLSELFQDTNHFKVISDILTEAFSKDLIYFLPSNGLPSGNIQGVKHILTFLFTVAAVKCEDKG